MIIESKFRPAWWLINTHLQTIWSSQYRNIVKPQTSHQRIELTDGDFIDSHTYISSDVLKSNP